MFNFPKKEEIVSVPDWKKKVANFKEREGLARNQLQTTELSEYVSEILAEIPKCHICGKDSVEPRVSKKLICDGQGTSVDEYANVVDWSRPKDLFKCYVCGEWTCGDCHVDGICKNEWAKKLGQEL